MRYGVIGARDFKGSIYSNYEYISQVLGGYKSVTEIISGGGRGVENLAETWAKEHNIPCQTILPNIKLHGMNEAFIHRNLKIMDVCDTLLIFWDGFNNTSISPLTAAAQQFKTVHIIPMR